MNELDEYKARRESMSQMDQAVAESALYKRLCPSGWKQTARSGRAYPASRSRWLSAHGINGGQYRYAVLALGRAADPVWEKVHNGEMTISAAAKLCVRAKRRGGDLSESVSVELEAYSKKPIVKRGSNGKEIRCERIKKRRPRKKLWASTAARGVLSASSDRVFWASIKALVVEHVESRASQLAPSDRRQLAGDLVQEIDVVIRLFGCRIQKMRERAVVLVGKSELMSACESLSIDPPEPQTDLRDWIKVAAKKQRQLARMYHPDANGGDDSMRDQYQQVVEALVTCESYVNQRPQNKEAK